MNRAERRKMMRDGRKAGANGHGHGHMDCGCTQRLLQPLRGQQCPECGLEGPNGVFTMPMSSRPGEIVELGVGCRCGAEFVLPFEVVR
jgi:hypothetical protein